MQRRKGGRELYETLLRNSLNKRFSIFKVIRVTIFYL